MNNRRVVQLPSKGWDILYINLILPLDCSIFLSTGTDNLTVVHTQLCWVVYASQNRSTWLIIPRSVGSRALVIHFTLLVHFAGEQSPFLRGKLIDYAIFAQECGKERWFFSADYLSTAKRSTAVLVGNRICCYSGLIIILMYSKGFDFRRKYFYTMAGCARARLPASRRSGKERWWDRTRESV